MKKRIYGRKFNRDINERKALFKSLMRALVLKERIKTTEPRAKAIKGELEKYITKAKNKGEGARDYLLENFGKDAVNKIITNLAPRFKERPGGYIRIIKEGHRLKDNAPMVLMEWTEAAIIVPEVIETKEEKKTEEKSPTTKSKNEDKKEKKVSKKSKK